jgi:futalosine hydrolase
MEGAAVHYVGLMENVPFLQLRSISNLVGERDKKKWKLPLSIKNLNQTLIDLLKRNDLIK